MDNDYRMTPEDRYRKEPFFRALVNVLIVLLEQYTPDDLREAVELAISRYAARHTLPLIF